MTKQSGREKLLIVDDEFFNIRALGEVLRTTYEVFTATDGRMALDLAARYRPDLVLLDIQMPEMDGYEVCREMQADQLLCAIPIIFVTSLTGEEDENIGLSLGAVDYITRPFRPAIIRQRIKNQLELKRRREEKLHRVEKSLRESEERFRLFMDMSPTVTWIKDEEGRVVYLSKTFEKYFNVREKDALGKSDAELWSPDVAEKYRLNDLDVMRANRPAVFTDKIVRPDGNTHYWLTSKFPYTDAVGSRFIGGVALDITRQKQLEQELQRQVEEISILKQQVESENVYLRNEIRTNAVTRKLVDTSMVMKQLVAQAELIAQTNVTVLIQGETGSGKELIAQHIHERSSRNQQNFYKISCAAIPSTLLENELFGHEKGAYTGAQERQIGHFELADKATLFLDEIGELPLEAQAKLLRVIQEGEFSRVGSPRVIKTDVRIIAATNRDLAEEVRRGSFREDLYYRLSVFPLIVPPLRERFEDIPQLVWSLVHEIGVKMGKPRAIIDSQDMNALQMYSWPGNVRELRNVIEHAFIFSPDKKLHIRIPEFHRQVGKRSLALQDIEHQHITEVLTITNWRVRGKNGAARLLDLHPNTLYSRMKKLGIPTQNLRDDISFNRRDIV